MAGVFIVAVYGGFLFFRYYSQKNNPISPVKVLSVQEKAQNEIIFSKNQVAKATKIFTDLKNISEKVEAEYGGYPHNIDSREIDPGKFYLSKAGEANLQNGKIVLTETESPQNKNSAYFDLLIPSQRTDIEMSFNYTFINGGDGDQLGVWVDDQQVFVLTGSLLCSTDGSVCPSSQFSNFSFGGEEGQTHVVTFALHAYGDINSKVEISNIKIDSIKKDIFLEEQILDRGLSSLKEFIIEKNPDITSFKLLNLSIPDSPIDAMSGFFATDDALKKAEVAYSKAEFDNAYAYALYARLVSEKMVSDWEKSFSK